MKGITIYHFTERVTLIALDEFGIFFVEKVARIVISQLQSARQVGNCRKLFQNQTKTYPFH